MELWPLPRNIYNYISLSPTPAPENVKECLLLHFSLAVCLLVSPRRYFPDIHPISPVADHGECIWAIQRQAAGFQAQVVCSLFRRSTWARRSFRQCTWFHEKYTCDKVLATQQAPPLPISSKCAFTSHCFTQLLFALYWSHTALHLDSSRVFVTRFDIAVFSCLQLPYIFLSNRIHIACFRLSWLHLLVPSSGYVSVSSVSFHSVSPDFVSLNSVSLDTPGSRFASSIA